ncbi:hypothetical protein Tco_0385665 [Tanacetum coccineum]
MASTALGHDQPAVPSEDVEEREEEEVPLRRKRSAYRRARTEFSTPAFEQFQANLSCWCSSSHAKDAQARKRFEEEQASERLVQRLRAEDLAQEDLPNVSEERAKELDDLMMRMTETDWLTLMMQVGSNPALARELLGADVNEENFIERMNAVKEKKKRALADLRYRALKGKPMKKSEVTQMMRNLVKNQCQLVFLLLQLYLDDPDSAGGGSSNPAGSATPMAGSAASNTAGGAFGATVTGRTITITAVGFCWVHAGKSISGDGVVFVDKLPDDKIVDPRVKVENRFLSMHLLLLGLGSESESDDDMENYIPPLPYGEFKDWEIVSCPPIVTIIFMFISGEQAAKVLYLLKQFATHVFLEDLLSFASLYPKSSVHVLDLMNGKTVYMFVDKFYPIRATLLERMLRHRLTVPPSYCRDVVVAGNIIQDGSRLAYGKHMSILIAPMLPKKSGWYSFPMFLLDEKCLSKRVRSVLASPEQTVWVKRHVNCCMAVGDWKLLFYEVATHLIAVHRVHAVSICCAVLDELLDYSVMSDSDESGVTYMEVSSLFEGLSDIGLPRADDHEAAPPSLDYVPGLEYADDETVAEDQPYAKDASPTAQSPNYVLEADPEVDPEEDDDEDPEEDPVDYPADYPADGGDDGDDADEPLEEGYEATPPPHPAYRMTARISIPAPVPTPVWSNAEVARTSRISTPPITTSLMIRCTNHLGYHHPWPYRFLTSSPPFLLPSASRREDRPEVTLPPRKRLGIALGPRYEVGESSSAAAARLAGGLRVDYGFVATMVGETCNHITSYLSHAQHRIYDEREVGHYGIIELLWDEIVETYRGHQLVLTRSWSQRHLLAGRLNMLFRDKRTHAYTRHQMETEARLSREAWRRSMDTSDLAHGEVMSLRTTVLGQMSEIRELHAADRKRHAVTSEMLKADHRRSAEMRELRTADHTRQQQLIQTLTVM